MPDTTVRIPGDQLTPAGSARAGVAPGDATVLMIESLARARQRPSHTRTLPDRGTRPAREAGAG
jgi:hypothetical protein